MTSQQRVGHRFGHLPAPVGRGACHHGAPAGAQPACKAVVTARRRRRAGTARNFQRARILARQVQGIFGRRPPKSVIINDYAGGVTVAVDVAVKGYHRHAALVGLAYRRRQCLGLVGGDNEDVEVVVDKILDVSNLFLVAVVGRTYLHHGVLVQHDLAIDFFVHLLAPVVLAALRHTYFIYLLLGTSHRCRKNGNTYYNKVQFFHVVIRVLSWIRGSKIAISFKIMCIIDEKLCIAIILIPDARFFIDLRDKTC